MPGPTCGRCSAQPLAQPERDKARAIVMASTGIAESVDGGPPLRRRRAEGHRRDQPARTAGGALPAGGRTAERPSGLTRDAVAPATPVRDARMRATDGSLPTPDGAARRARAGRAARRPAALASRAFTLVSRFCTLVIRLAMASASLVLPAAFALASRACALGTQVDDLGLHLLDLGLHWARAAWRTAACRCAVPVEPVAGVDAPAMPAAPKVRAPATAAPAMIVRNMVSSLDCPVRRLHAPPPSGGTTHTGCEM